MSEYTKPFQLRYKIGDKFKVINTRHGFFDGFDSKVLEGDLLLISRVDDRDYEQPYKVETVRDMFDYNWGGCCEFQKVVEQGYVVLVEDKPTYDTITLGGITYNLVPQ
jgi:hypothetical protein